MNYTLQTSRAHLPEATYDGGHIRVFAPEELVRGWADSEQIGIYFDLPAGASVLTVAIEKDLECIDGPPDERDPEAFPRTAEKVC